MKISPVNYTVKNNQYKQNNRNAAITPQKSNFTFPPFKTYHYTLHIKIQKEDKKPDSKTISERTAYLKEQGITDFFAKNIAELPDEQYNRALETLNLGLYEEYVKEITDLEPKKYKQAIELLNKGITDENLHGLASLSEKKYQRASELYDKGIDSSDIRFFINLNKSEMEKALDNLREGIAPYIAANLAKLNKQQEETAIKLLVSKIDPENAFRIAKMDKKTQSKCMQLISMGINAEYVQELARLKKRPAQKINSLLNLNIGDINIADFANFNGEQYAKAIQLLNKCVFPDYIPDIIALESGIRKNNEYFMFRQEGFGENASFSMSLLDKEEQEKIREFISKNPEIKKLLDDNYDIEIVNIRESDEYVLILNKESRCPNGTKISFIQLVDNDGNITGHKTEEYYNHATSSRIFNKSDIFNVKYGKYGDIREMTQFIRNKDNNGISGVLFSKESKLLPGCFETTYYDINDFKQSDDTDKVDFDIEQSVKTEGIQISSVHKNKDGSITYEENWEYGNFRTKRNYTEKKDNHENILFSQYSYIIQDKSRNELLNTSRSFKRNADGSTTNIINGIEYCLKYDDTKKSIQISDGKQTKEIEFGNKLAYYSQEILWEIIKGLPVDTILTIHKNADKWNLCMNSDSAANGISKTISTGTDTSIIMHETGHLKEYEDETILLNKDLNDIYMQEMKQFQEIIPYNEQEFIEYFSPRSQMCDSDGLNELIAETNIILSTYGVSYEELRTRSQLIERYFPQTIIKIAELTGKNSSLNLLDQI